ncbi:hypothetical protein LTR94_023884 [Friedmanniomyces endolithicus]|nr:hypothetical protein LTR94_023884 [Friedmanniomyces endolithicus]
MGARISRRLRQVAEAEGLRTSELSPLMWMATRGPRHAGVTQVGPWMLIGDVLNRRHPSFDDITDVVVSYERKIIARFWGRYIGLRCNSDGMPKAVLRDAVGAMDCVVWEDRGLTFIASEAPNWLLKTFPPQWSINFDRLAAGIHDPNLAHAHLFLDGPTAVRCGGLLDLSSGMEVSLWSPAAAARRSCYHRPSDHDAADELREAVEEAVWGLAGISGPILCEVSGGLDSSIVASCLTTAPKADVRVWLNSYGPDPSSDERPYVDALAEQLQFDPTSAYRRLAPFDSAVLNAMPQGFRPALSALDTPHDADWAARQTEAGAVAMFTGNGGDPMFVQPVPETTFADMLKDQGWRAFLSPALPTLARRSEVSVWSLIAVAAGRRVPNTYPPIDLGAAVLSPQEIHPWLLDLDGLGPAKTYQLSNLISALAGQGPSLKTQVADVFNPLLSQPVVETCLGLSIEQLTLGRRDRALARFAFADQLPPTITQRRSKGELTAFYGLMIADGLVDLRSWLLQGRLAEKGLIDKQALDRRLMRAELAANGGYGEILTLAAFEGWVRAWEARLGASERRHEHGQLARTENNSAN